MPRNEESKTSRKNNWQKDSTYPTNGFLSWKGEFLTIKEIVAESIRINTLLIVTNQLFFEPTGTQMFQSVHFNSYADFLKRGKNAIHIVT